ncbi:hypothetical protein [Gymnodinialimonas ceratoperidinii]|uniref:Uncharacterized protein n=1 Tax=Gymnodinialimonas ceratoperidinii TaxID=2856823 RepID=A0A8F6YCE8_9RHOB|nr:hypothetical protein [Gymnodinialimonas ceratoperidinii]QXT41166.1 hypothetical protein KYE46_08145 [Gymnodinialimonas ceratoperidinii]
METTINRDMLERLETLECAVAAKAFVLEHIVQAIEDLDQKIALKMANRLVADAAEQPNAFVFEFATELSEGIIHRQSPRTTPAPQVVNSVPPEPNPTKDDGEEEA